MAVDFAALEDRIGAVGLARLSNATMLVTVGGASIDGIYDHRAVDPALGMAGMVARDVVFTCSLSEALSSGLSQSSAVKITYKGATSDWEVLRFTEHDDVGHAEIILQAPGP